MPRFSKSSSSSTFLNRLMLSNDPPCPVEEPFVRSSLSQSLRKLSRLDQDIASHLSGGQTDQRTLRDLSSSRRRVDWSISVYRSILSPLRRIPQEVIAKIIQHALSLEGDMTVSLDTTRGPWKYRQISRGWHDATLWAPRIWSHIEIDCEDLKSIPTNCDLVMRTLLELSGNQPLTISVVTARTKRFSAYSCPETPAAEIVLDALIEQSDRWQDVHFEFNSIIGLLKLSSVKDRVSRLERLDLYTRFDNGLKDQDTDLHLDAFCNAPNLRILRLDSRTSRFTSDFPIRQLKSYTEHGAHFDSQGHNYVPVWLPYRHLIPQFANIVTLELIQDKWMYHADYNIPDNVHYSLPRLQTLICRYASFIENLIAPSLERLEILEPSTFSGFLELCHRSQCELQVLILHSVDLRNPAFNRLEELRRIPTLTHLHIHTLSYDTRFVDALRLDYPHSPLLPNLESFTWVCNLSRSAIEDEDLLRRSGGSEVVRRQNAVPCVTKFLFGLLSLYDRFDLPMVKQMARDMKRKGLEDITVVVDPMEPLLLSSPPKYFLSKGTTLFPAIGSFRYPY